MDAESQDVPAMEEEGCRIGTEGEISRGVPKGNPAGILRVDSGKARRTSLDIKLLSQHEPASPQPSVDRLSVTFADDSQRSDRTESSQKTMDKAHFPTGNTDEENSDDEDYSASVTAIMQRRASTRRSKKRSGRRGSSPFSPDILPDNESGRRRSSVFTTSSGDTAITMEDSFTPSVTQDQIFENIKLHKEVLGSVKMQPWNMRKKLRLVMQAKEYIKKHEGALQERLAQSHSTRDILARCNIYLIKKWQHFKREAANLSNWLIPWEKRIKEIESHFGSVVASYFIFLRWLFWVNMVISIVLVAFVAVPEMLMADFKKDPERKTILPEDRFNSTNFLTLWDFEGVFKYSPMFYGWYTNLDLVDKAYRLPLAYFFTGLAVYVYSFVATLRKMAKNSRMSKLSEKDDECIFSWKLFTGWDYMIGNAETAHNRVASIVMSFKEALLEEAEKKRESKSWKLIGSRILVNTGVLGLLFLSAFAVVTVVARSNEKEANSTTWRRNEITVVMSLISLFFPILFELLGYFEHYHPRKQLRLQLARIMVLNLLNLYSLIFALFGKISNMTNDLQALKPTNATSFSPELTTKFPVVLPQPTEIATYNNCYTICEQNGLEIANLISETFSSLYPTASPQKLQRAISVTLNNLTQSAVTPTPVDLSNVFKFDLSGLRNKLQDFLDDITDEGMWEYVETTTQSSTTTEISETLKNKCRQQCEALNDTLKLPVVELTDYQKRSRLRSLCWETMFGQELVKLTVMDLVMTVLSSLAIDFLRGLFVRYVNNFWCWDLEKTFPQYGDFKVAENILHLVNNQGMVWMGMFFSPGLVVLNVVKLYIMMYLRSWAVLACNVPHEIIFRASRSNNFYFALLLMMLFLCVLPVGFTIVWLEPSWHCGPFSKYHRIFHIFTKTIRKALPEPFHKILDYTASPGIVIPLLMLLVLIIYYLISLTNALREANNDLKIQLRRERTEERRKMFQIADRRTRSGSGESELNQFGKWKKLLQGMPGNKSFDDTPKEISEIEDQQQLAAKKVLSRFIFRSIKNRKPSVNQSDEESVLQQDDGTDTDQHESLPDDASFRLRPPLKRDSLENGERKPYKRESLKPKDDAETQKAANSRQKRTLKSREYKDGHSEVAANKSKSKDSCDSEERTRRNDSTLRKMDSLDGTDGNRKKPPLKKMDSLEPVLPKQKHKLKHKKQRESYDRKLRKFDSFIRSSTESGDRHVSIKEPAGKKERVHRVDSVGSNWSDNIPVITISKTESTECILETLNQDAAINESDAQKPEVCDEAAGSSGSRAMKLLRSKFGGDARKSSEGSFFKSIIGDKNAGKQKEGDDEKLGSELRKSGENSGSIFKSMIRDRSTNSKKSDADKKKLQELKHAKKSDASRKKEELKHAKKIAEATKADELKQSQENVEVTKADESKKSRSSDESTQPEELKKNASAKADKSKQSKKKVESTKADETKNAKGSDESTTAEDAKKNTASGKADESKQSKEKVESEQTKTKDDSAKKDEQKHTMKSDELRKPEHPKKSEELARIKQPSVKGGVELTQIAELSKPGDSKTTKKHVNLARTHKNRPALKKQTSEFHKSGIDGGKSEEDLESEPVKSAEAGNSGRAAKFFMNLFKGGQNKSAQKSEDESSKVMMKNTEEKLKQTAIDNPTEKNNEETNTKSESKPIDSKECQLQNKSLTKFKDGKALIFASTDLKRNVNSEESDEEKRLSVETDEKSEAECKPDNSNGNQQENDISDIPATEERQQKVQSLPLSVDTKNPLSEPINSEEKQLKSKVIGDLIKSEANFSSKPLNLDNPEENQNIDALKSDPATEDNSTKTKELPRKEDISSSLELKNPMNAENKLSDNECKIGPEELKPEKTQDYCNTKKDYSTINAEEDINKLVKVGEEILASGTIPKTENDIKMTESTEPTKESIIRESTEPSKEKNIIKSTEATKENNIKESTESTKEENIKESTERTKEINFKESTEPTRDTKIGESTEPTTKEDNIRGSIEPTKDTQIRRSTKLTKEINIREFTEPTKEKKIGESTETTSKEENITEPTKETKLREPNKEINIRESTEPTKEKKIGESTKPTKENNIKKSSTEPTKERKIKESTESTKEDNIRGSTESTKEINIRESTEPIKEMNISESTEPTNEKKIEESTEPTKETKIGEQSCKGTEASETVNSDFKILKTDLDSKPGDESKYISLKPATKRTSLPENNSKVISKSSTSVSENDASNSNVISKTTQNLPENYADKSHITSKTTNCFSGNILLDNTSVKLDNIGASTSKKSEIVETPLEEIPSTKSSTSNVTVPILQSTDIAMKPGESGGSSDVLKEPASSQPSESTGGSNNLEETFSGSSHILKETVSVQNLDPPNILKETTSVDLSEKPEPATILKQTSTLQPDLKPHEPAKGKELPKTKQSFFSKLRKRKEDKAKKTKKEKSSSSKQKNDDTTPEAKEEPEDVISPITRRISFKFPALAKSKPDAGFSTNVFMENVSDQAVGTLKSLEKFTPGLVNVEGDDKKFGAVEDSPGTGKSGEVLKSSESCPTGAISTNSKRIPLKDEEELDVELCTAVEEIDSEAKCPSKVEAPPPKGPKLPDSKPVIVFEHYKFPDDPEKSILLGITSSASEKRLSSGLPSKDKGLELFSESSSSDDVKNPELKKAESSSSDESGKFDTIKRKKLLKELKPENETESSTEYKDGTISN